MQSLKTTGIVLTFILGASVGGASCMLPSTHCAYNTDIECEANEVCSRCEQGNSGCALLSVVDPRCYAYPEEDEGESTTGESSGGPTTPGETDESTSESGGSNSAGESTTDTSTSTSTTNASDSATADPTLPTNPFCGDGEVAGDEECDDQNLDNDDFCISCKDAFCGDGHVSPIEECDDKNYVEDDGCNNMCARDRVVFVTSTWSNGDLSGIVGATNTCIALAVLADYEDPDNFIPWLSDADSSPSTSFFKSRGRYVLSDMVTVVADDWDDLVDGTLQNAIDVDENGLWLDGSQAWTGTLASGERDPDDYHCDGWSTGMGANGMMGYTGDTDEEWSWSEWNACGANARIYCFEQQ